MRLERRLFLRSSAALLGAGALGSGDGHAEQIHPHHVHAASRLTQCANRFLAALDANQRGKATFSFESDERLNWHFIPKERKGLPLREMTPYQKRLASALLAAGLSQTGYIKAVTIMSLGDVLKIIENDGGEHRNPEKYYFSVFGAPSDSGTWGYRVEGHHFSQNYTVVNGKVIDGPSFFGANPAEVRQGPRKGLRTLAGEEDLGIEVIHALDEQQQKVAIVDPTAYKDILTAASRKAALQGQPSGLPCFPDERQSVRRPHGPNGRVRAQRARRTGRRPGRADKQSRPEYPLRLVGRNQSWQPTLLSRSDGVLPD
jgi:hypothetical protein